MDTLTPYRQIIRDVLTPYLKITYANVDAKNYAAFDPETDQYLVTSVGWSRDDRIHSCLIHLSIENGKVWIQCDNTEDGIANELIAAGIPKDTIVLGFREPAIRPYTGFAVA